MKVHGECLCQSLTWEAEVDPAAVSICHCRDCQTLSGSAFRLGVLVLDDQFRFLSGVPKTYVKTAASGNKRELAFCPNCGTSVFSRPAGGKGYFAIRVGSLRERDQLVPTTQDWCNSELSWIAHLKDVPRQDEE